MNIFCVRAVCGFLIFLSGVSIMLSGCQGSGGGESAKVVGKTFEGIKDVVGGNKSGSKEKPSQVAPKGNETSGDSEIGSKLRPALDTAKQANSGKSLKDKTAGVYAPDPLSEDQPSSPQPLQSPTSVTRGTSVQTDLVPTEIHQLDLKSSSPGLSGLPKSKGAIESRKLDESDKGLPVKMATQDFRDITYESDKTRPVKSTTNDFSEFTYDDGKGEQNSSTKKETLEESLRNGNELKSHYPDGQEMQKKGTKKETLEESLRNGGGILSNDSDAKGKEKGSTKKVVEDFNGSQIFSHVVYDSKGNQIGVIKNGKIETTSKDFSGAVYDEKGNQKGEINFSEGR